jgi:hypothetical protein
MNALNRFSSITLAVLIGVFAAQAPANAQIGPDPNNKPHHARIVGLWDVDVTITNCATGDPLFPPFPAMHKYERGGTGQVVPATSPSALSAHMLVWSYAGNNQYQTAMKMFRFDGAGNYIGWVEVISEAEINPAGDEYEGSGVAEFFNPAGDVVATSCPIFTGTRFTGES